MNLAGDIRYAIRGLVRRPGFTLVAVLTLALGIGANAAIFSAVRGILLRPLPFRAPARLVAFNAEQFVSNAELLFLRDNAKTLGGVAAISPGWGMALTGVGEATQLTTARVSTNLLDVLGVRPMFGRTFQQSESIPGNEMVAILGYSLWAERFGSDPSVIGRNVVLDGTPYNVVGVLPPGFEVLGKPADLWTPLVFDPTAWFHKGAVSWFVGRLRDGTTMEQSRAELATLFPRMRETFEYAPDYYRNVSLVPLQERAVGSVRTALLVLLAAVGFIVLIAGANVGNLLLMRAAGRRREIAVRTALGASGRRVIAQMLVESVVLALGGAATGVALGAVGVRVLRASLPADTPRLGSITLDGTVLTMCAALAILIGIAFGLAPALLASRGDAQDARGARGVAGRAGGERTRGTLVVAEVALTLVLVIGAGLMMRTLWSLSHVDAGFRAGGVLTLRVQPSGERYNTNEKRVRYVQTLLERLGALPGVQSTGMIHHLPLAGYAWYANIELEGRVRAPNEAPLRSGWRVIEGDYFMTMGIPLVRGRAFSTSDTRSATPVVIVNEAFARAAWPGEDPIGKRFTAGNATRGSTAVTVVGVVGDVRHVSLDARPEPELYRPHAQTPMGAVTLALRTSGDPLAVAGLARQAVNAIDTDVPISDVRSMEQVMSESVARPRLIMSLLLVFAGVGVILGAVGVYGVIAYAVGERRREIGVRIALGAEPGRVAGAVLVQGMRYAAVGVAIGLAGSLAVTRVMRTLVFGVSTTDPLTFVGLSLFLVTVAALASYLPARQAARTDPMVALRADWD